MYARRRPACEQTPSSCNPRTYLITVPLQKSGDSAMHLLTPRSSRISSHHGTQRELFTVSHSSTDAAARTKHNGKTNIPGAELFSSFRSLKGSARRGRPSEVY
eukprot:Gregarina_sp_Pseudo_9__5244@NODE_593_length_2536_cov_137_581498_g559_i0_p6_GENE_NODE_593_length_2536_cov_137_581498_g559_i0NODE_593_length_2536_cov_137_581498_g559_i0_p6_ORF_typecomplete_len103_score3_84Defensin_int/PF17858_1/0_072Defensin_int/PF17858_1/7_9e03Defensin_int/PF17858_1/7_4e03Orexin/PF02072_15/0_093_NODE_593_length_2536_cov_137_581498_g559_i018972205